jgi:hypothetical protein
MRAWRIPLQPVNRKDPTGRRRSSDHHSPRVAFCNKPTIRFHCSNINFNIMSRYIDWFFLLVSSIHFFWLHTYLHIYLSLSRTYISRIWQILQITKLLIFKSRGGVVVKALRYKPAGRVFDSRWCHWNFSVTYSFRSHYGPRVDSHSNRNEYQVYFLGVTAAGA